LDDNEKRVVDLIVHILHSELAAEVMTDTLAEDLI
jgi:hypothetical protein